MYWKTLAKAMRWRRWASIIVLAAGLAMGWGMTVGQAMARQKPDASAAALIKKAREDVAAPKWLAGIHFKKESIDCQGCHGDNPIPDDTAGTVNANCINCHGGYGEMAEVSKKKSENPDINVHASHLGPEIGCTVCHQGHKASKAYCLYCHTNFDLPIPGGASK